MPVRSAILFSPASRTVSGAMSVAVRLPVGLLTASLMAASKLESGKVTTDDAGTVTGVGVGVVGVLPAQDANTSGRTVTARASGTAYRIPTAPSLMPNFLGVKTRTLLASVLGEGQDKG